MSWKGLTPFRNGVRVVPYWGEPVMVRVDVQAGDNRFGFDMPQADFGDDAKLAVAINAARLYITVEQVRKAA